MYSDVLYLLTNLFLRIIFNQGSTLALDEKTEQKDLGENLTLTSKLDLVSRLEWVAEPPVERSKLEVPVPYVIVHQTATRECDSKVECILKVRFIQTFHMVNRNWWDIGYNFLVGGDGKAYVGRGWTSVGAHTSGNNSKSIGIAFIGVFKNNSPPNNQITACKQLVERGIELGYIKKDYKLLSAKQFNETGYSSGEKLYEEIKTWDHWSSQP